MTMWEYVVVDLSKLSAMKETKTEEEAKLLSTLGKQGWELVAVTDMLVPNNARYEHKAYLKREMTNLSAS